MFKLIILASRILRFNYLPCPPCIFMYAGQYSLYIDERYFIYCNSFFLDLKSLLFIMKSFISLVIYELQFTTCRLQIRICTTNMQNDNIAVVPLYFQVNTLLIIYVFIYLFIYLFIIFIFYLWFQVLGSEAFTILVRLNVD